MKKILASIQIFLVVSLSIIFSLSLNSRTVNAQEQQVCCEKDDSGNFCSYVPASSCTGSGVIKAATSCDQTSFCKAGCCAGIDGYCYSGYPKALCEDRGGTYSSGNCNTVAQCKLGCCIIGTQADYITKDRCIQETGNYPDLEVDFRENVNSEAECLNLAKNTEQGCCVTDGSCTYGTKSECTVEQVINGTGFYKNIYCSAEQLRNKCSCAPSNGDPKATMCLPDRDEVYWKDSCGNPEGIKEECDYNQGTLCGDSDKDGRYICESLDCQDGTRTASQGTEKLSLNLEGYKTHGTSEEELNEDGILNGESWCQYDNENQQQIQNDFSTSDRQGKDPVGSRYYRSICINGQELIEPCKDFREEYCYSNTIDLKLQTEKQYTESRCIENEWQPCVNECNTANPLTMDKDEYNEALQKDQQCCLSPNRDCAWTGSKCIPAVSPGFKFWEGEGTDVCGKASTECTTVFVCGGWNRIFGCGENEAAGITTGGLAGAGAGVYTGITLGTATLLGPVGLSALLAAGLVGASSWNSGWQIVSGGECLSQEYLQAANNLCRSYGDCGADYNFLADEKNLDSKFRLSRAGFSNTENIDEELRDYTRKNEDKLQAKSHGDLDLTFGPEGNGFEDDDPVPGNLTAEPDWEKGKEFFDFTRPEDRPERGFTGVLKRSLFTEGLFGQGGWAGGLSSPVGIAGLIFLGSLTTLAPGGIPGDYGVGLGLSASPLGFLVAQGIGHVFDVGILQKSAGTTAKSLIKEAGDRAYKKAIETAPQNVFKGSTLTGVEQQALRSALDNQGFKADVVSHLNSQQLSLIANGKEVEVGGGRIFLEKNGLLAARQEVSQKVGGEAAELARKQAEDNVAAKGFPSVMTGVSAALWAYTIFQLGDVIFEQITPVKIATTCQPWQAPVYKLDSEQDSCQRCNQDFRGFEDEEGYVDEEGNPKHVRALRACSEYRCKSLGASCELINKGTTEETCVSLNKLDVNSPKISPWSEGFTLDLTRFQVQQLPGDPNYKTGFKIVDNEDKGIPIYNVFNIGLQTDEPAQCKMSLEHSTRFDAMPNNYFGTNTFKYFHTNIMSYPATREINTTQGITLAGGGDYKLYVRCTDAVGNANEADYVIELKVEDEPDLTAPIIAGSSLSPPNTIGQESVLGDEVYLTAGAEYTDILLYVNEPAECKYSYNPLEYNLMDEANKCIIDSTTPDNPPYYSCQFVRGAEGAAGIGPAPADFVSRAGLLKYVYFKCRDKHGNFNKEAYTVTLRGSDPLNITMTKPSGTIKTSTAITNVTLELVTAEGAELNGKAVCKYTTEEILRNNLAAMTEFLNTGTSLHTQPWQPSSGLQKFYTGCYDKAGNTAYTGIDFTVEQDITPPFITKVYRDETYQPPQFTIELNEPGECKDSAENTFNYDTGGNLMNTANEENTIFTSTISDSNIYYVVCRDDFGNIMNPAVIQIAEV